MRTNVQLVERFHRVLVDEIRKGAPAYLRTSFTVAEIYQSLIPYRTHRDRLGVEMNGDYEDALLRLLGGEGEFLLLESEPARARIRKELQSANPNTGIYREFAAVGVRLNPILIPEPESGNGRTGSSGEGAKPEQTSFEALTEASGAGFEAEGRPAGDAESAPVATGEGVGEATSGPGEEGVRRSAGRAPAARAASAPSGAKGKGAAPGATLPASDGPPASCPECNLALPDRASLRFCPHCGVNVFLVPCADCGEELERSWRFCLACGTERA